MRQPLGLDGMAGVISQGARPRFAAGYWPADRVTAAVLPGAPLALAYWTEEDNPAGSLGADAEQMATYLRALLRLGAGRGAPLLSAAAARPACTTPAA